MSLTMVQLHPSASRIFSHVLFSFPMLSKMHVSNIAANMEANTALKFIRLTLKNYDIRICLQFNLIQYSAIII